MREEEITNRAERVIEAAIEENGFCQGKYILVTPCKNEGTNLPNLIRSLTLQTRKPVLWVIVDDGSTDRTPEIIEEAVERQNWIKGIRLDSNNRDLGLNLTQVVKRGFEFAIEYCKNNGIDYKYLGNVDGDITLEHTFFENIIKEFENDPKLGIASGGTNHIVGDRVIHAKLRDDEPSGGHMVIRRECYEDCGGIPLSYALDSVLKAKARLRGWKTRRFETAIATEIRDVGSAEGYWKGFMHDGRSDYYLGYHPVHVVIKGMKFCKRPWYGGIAYLSGYLNSLIRRKDRIADDEVKIYFRNKWKCIISKQRLFRLRGRKRG